MELDQAIFQYARERGIKDETVRRWQALGAPDQGSLLELARALKLGQSHFLDVLDWCTEISLRDGMPLAALIARDEIALVLRDTRLGRNDKVKHVKATLRRLRYPRLTRIEGEVQQRLRSLRTDPRITLAVAPGLEGGVKVSFSALSAEGLERLALEVAAVARAQETRELFELLSGTDDATLSTR